MQLTKTTFFLFLMAFAACKQESKPATGASTSTPTETAVNAKPELVLYAVNVDNLQLRDQPNTKTSQVIAKFREGSIVMGEGEKSTNQEEIDLRGIPFKDYFCKVSSTTSEQQTGWAFGGALTAVYAGTRGGSPDLSTLAQYSTYLMGLNAKEINSGRKVWDYVNTNFGNATGALADAVYVLTVRYLSQMEYESEFYTITEKFDWTPEDYEAIFQNKFDMNKYPITKRLAENGFRVGTGEGIVFPIADWVRLHAFFSPKATPAMKAFLDQQFLEQKDLESSDGGLVVSIATLAERAAFWEKFNKQYPWFLLSERTMINEEWQRNVLVTGLDNTPTRDFETGKIDEEFKKVWLDIPQKYPGTVLATKIKELTDLCAANNWMYNEKIENWVMKFQEEN